MPASQSSYKMANCKSLRVSPPPIERSGTESGLKKPSENAGRAGRSYVKQS